MCIQDCEYELIKQGLRAGCGTENQIERKIPDTNEDTCKEKCDRDKKCTHIWHRQGMKMCKLYSSCNGESRDMSNQVEGKRFKKKLGLGDGK